MRTDIHRPSQIEPADYDFVAFECLKIEDFGDAQFLAAERARIRAHMGRTGGTYSHHEHGGNCHICGSVNVIYTALFYHKPSNVYVRTGLNCADKLDCGEVERFRREVRTALEQRAGKNKAKALLDLHGLAAAWSIYTDQEADGREETTLRDIVGRLVKYGSISDKQMAFVGRLLDTIARRAEIAAQRAAEAETAAPVPVSDKRMTVRGKVLSIRVPDYNRGECGPVRMLVQHADGWKVWGSLPIALADIERGTEVEFDAAVKPSDKDTKFGFFSRPTKAQVITRAAA
jgi:hypothetical protein